MTYFYIKELSFVMESYFALFSCLYIFLSLYSFAWLSVCLFVFEHFIRINPYWIVDTNLLSKITWILNSSSVLWLDYLELAGDRVTEGEALGAVGLVRLDVLPGVVLNVHLVLVGSVSFTLR